MAERLGIALSADSLLRLVRKTENEQPCCPRAVGIDDWAFRKGQRYGTLICDLENGRALDLLPDRDTDSVADWLRGRPSVAIVSRDRSDIYRKGTSAGAPTAVQVADRFHLMKNIRDAFARFLESQTKQLNAALKKVSFNSDESEEIKPDPLQSTPTAKAQTRKGEARKRRQEKYDLVMKLAQLGVSARSIAKQVGIHRSTVRKYVQADDLPQRTPGEYASTADPFKDYLWARWQSGCRNGALLWRELLARGYDGSYHSVRRLVQRWRKADPKPDNAKSPPRTLSPNQASWLLFKKPLRLSEEDQTLKRAVLEHCDEIRRVWQLTRRFVVILRRRRGRRLKAWVKKATKDEAPGPIRQFAAGLKDDWDAVVAGLSLPWNNGMAEGHISRLKLIKRQMYGRANFDLLRTRFLAAA